MAFLNSYQRGWFDFKLALLTLLTFNFCLASEAPKVGRKAAAKYFQTHGYAQNNAEGNDRTPSSFEGISGQEHYLAFGLGRHTASTAYNWGNSSDQSDLADIGVDLTYRLKQEYELFDQVVKISYNEYEPVGKKATKMSFLYGMTFPDAGSQFPLYFGLVAGPGIFFKQVNQESSLSFDYQLFMGLRLFNIFENTGFFVEGGLKNHLHLTSDGQLNATFFSVGGVFTF